MAAYFFDSSALVKRYVEEVGTGWVRDLTRRRALHQIYLAGITPVEVTAAIARRRKGGTLTPARVTTILYRFRKHIAGRYRIAEITPALLARAMMSANTHELRAYDAVQLAAALDLQRQRLASGLDPVTLVSADRELNAAAVAEGLAVEDPNAHP